MGEFVLRVEEGKVKRQELLFLFSLVQLCVFYFALLVGSLFWVLSFFLRSCLLSIFNTHTHHKHTHTQHSDMLIGSIIFSDTTLLLKREDGKEIGNMSKTMK